MGKLKEEKSDDIEIISIGNLYTGPWDKKYWSSSRGKDRYPYPVGYKSIRVQNGVTYEMEILEGLKGPLFTISSTDGKSCSGDTPDITWENFQKKGCSQIKLWRGKRFTCKINGVELYGFKNPFVQRLLRELVANVSETEQSILTSNYTNRSPNTVDKLQTEEADPDLIPCLVKTQVTGKRSRTDKIVITQRLTKTHIKQHEHAECVQEASATKSRQRDKSDGRGTDPSVVAPADDISSFCHPGAAAMEEKGKSLSITETRMQLDPKDMSGHLKTDRSISEETDADTNVQHIMPVLSDANLCAPDSLDHSGDILCASSLDNHEQITCNMSDAIANDEFKSGILVTDSHQSHEMCPSACSTFSEKSDTDSVGQEIAKSMMTVLLPRAVPLLQTFSRKKKKSPKPLTVPIHGYQEKNNTSNTSIHDGFISRELAERPDLEIKIEKTNNSSIGHDLFVSTSEYTEYVVPDSFDHDDPGNALPHTYKADKVSDDLDARPQLPINTNGDATTVLCASGTKEHKINLDYQAQVSLNEKPPEDTVLAPEKEITAKSKGAQRHCQLSDKPPISASTGKYSPSSKIKICRSSVNVGFSEKFEARFAEKLPNDADLVGLDISTSNLQESSTVCCHKVSVNGEIKDGSRLNIQQSSKLNSNNLQGLLDCCACYVLPMLVSMVQLSVKDGDIYMCVKCDSVEHKESTLFVYKALTSGDNMGCPSLIGYLPIGSESSKDAIGGDIEVDSLLLQFIPDAHLLVLRNNIRTPFCREGKLNCLCSACTSDCLKKNAVKIVHPHSGYVSLVSRLETSQDVRCVLVCEPNFLLAAEEGGKLKLWIMSSGWSEGIEDLYLQTPDCMFPCLVELKRVPRSSDMVIGHNGFGEFGLWDIVKQTLVSSFSSPGMSVSKCIPAGLFRWQRRGEHRIKELINEIMDATKISFAERNENLTVSPEDKDAAIWLLVSTVSDPDSQCYQSCEQQENGFECWRLALLVNNTVIVGSALDPGVASVTSAGHGIIGTSDGLVYMWELATGVKLGNLHSFRGSSVSCISTDTTNSGAVAIASGGQLLVYLPPILKNSGYSCLPN